MSRLAQTAPLSGKRAIVTGGAARVGRQIALALAEQGCDLLLHYGRSQTQAAEVAREAAALGVRVTTHAADLREIEATRSIVPAAIEALGGVDLLINNAAVFLEGGLLETKVDGWQSQLDVNLRAPFLLCQDLARHLGERDGEGAIVNILDARLNRAGDDHLAYRLTKSALGTLTESLALELAPSIRVNGVALGAILPPPGAAEGYLRELAEREIPLRRGGSPRMVAQSVIHLLEQPFATGVTIRLDGGQFL